MKAKLYLILFTLTVFSMSCRNDDDTNVGGQAIVTSDTSDTSGELTVKVEDSNGNAVSGVEVRLYATYEDLNNDIWIYSVFNDNRGEAYFGFINIGNYYIFARQLSNNRDNSPGDVVQVRSQAKEFARVIIN